MTAFARNLSVRLEFCLVLLVGFGPFIAMQFWNAVQRKPLHMTNAGLVAFPITELILFAAILWVGKVRGWSIAKFGFKISWWGTVERHHPICRGRNSDGRCYSRNAHSQSRAVFIHIFSTRPVPDYSDIAHQSRFRGGAWDRLFHPLATISG